MYQVQIPEVLLSSQATAAGFLDKWIYFNYLSPDTRRRQCRGNQRSTSDLHQIFLVLGIRIYMLKLVNHLFLGEINPSRQSLERILYVWAIRQ